MNGTNTQAPSVRNAYISQLLIFFAAFTINTLSIIALSRCTKIDKRIRVMLVNVSIADETMGCLPLVGVVNDYFGMSNTTGGCYLHMVLARFLTFAKIYSATILAIDRFVCLYLPNWYLKHVSGRLMLKVILVAWATSLVTTLLTYAGDVSYAIDCINENQSNGFIVVLIVSLICVIILIGSYIGVYINIKKHERIMKSLSSSETSQTRLNRSTVILFLLVSVFILCYTPSGVYRTIIYLYPEQLYNTRVVRNITDIIFLSSTFINPLLYVLRFGECRINMAKLVCWINKPYLERLNSKHKELHASYLPSRPFIIPLDRQLV